MKYILIFIFLLGSLFGGQLRHCYATWQDDPTHTLALHIHGINTSSSLDLYYDTHSHSSRYQDYAVHREIPLYKQYKGGRNLYHISLKELEPGTTYYFTLVDRGHVLGPERSFRTLNPIPPYRFIEAGDWENTEVAQKLAQVAACYEPDAVWLGGDYPTGVMGTKQAGLWDQWLDTYQHILRGPDGRIIPMVMAIGNHEVIGGFGQPRKNVPFYFDYFRPDLDSYFSLPLSEHAQLFILDSGHIASHHSQVSWLKKEMEQVQHKPLKIALYHVPLYPGVRFTEKGWMFRRIVNLSEWIGLSGVEKQLFSQPSLWGQKHWLPIFDALGLSIAFEHHDQCLKRTHLLKEGKKNQQGTLYLGDGGFGAQTQIIPIKGYLDPLYAKVKGRTPCFWLVEIFSHKTIVQAITLKHKILDYYELGVKGSNEI